MTGATSPANPQDSSLIVVSGMSGSGKSIALHTFEDLDYYCVDNLPADLLAEFVRGATGKNDMPPKLAVGIDVRNRNTDLSKLPSWLSQAGALGLDPRLVFFDAGDEILLKRYAETRRRHPLSHLGLALADAIAMERRILKPLRALADVIIDTSELNVHQMRRRVITELGLSADRTVSLLFESFAYRRGVPADADFVFDARGLPNPHWDARLRPLSGRDREVREYLDTQTDVNEYTAQVAAFLDNWLPRIQADTRSYVTVAFGCTGGRHRSVYLAETLAAHARKHGWRDVATYHRELE
jgi:RNase adapter protein RapZ